MKNDSNRATHLALQVLATNPLLDILNTSIFSSMPILNSRTSAYFCRQGLLGRNAVFLPFEQRHNGWCHHLSSSWHIYIIQCSRIITNSCEFCQFPLMLFVAICILGYFDVSSPHKLAPDSSRTKWAAQEPIRASGVWLASCRLLNWPALRAASNDVSQVHKNSTDTNAEWGRATAPWMSLHRYFLPVVDVWNVSHGCCCWC